MLHRAFRDPVALFLVLAVLLCVLAVMPTQSSSRHGVPATPVEAMPAPTLTPAQVPAYRAGE